VEVAEVAEEVEAAELEEEMGGEMEEKVVGMLPQSWQPQSWQLAYWLQHSKGTTS
jgi:hypothetical protein